MLHEYLIHLSIKYKTCVRGISVLRPSVHRQALYDFAELLQTRHSIIIIISAVNGLVNAAFSG
jgi:hypothetical protein